ncbi:MAG: 6-bladed beta-propeller [Candidatus Omnitrophota bacterium]
MKKTSIFVLIFIFISGLINFNILKAEIKNENKPLKGTWDFKLKKLWEAESATDDYIFGQIADIQVDDDGLIYVLEWKQYKFFVFDQKGKFLYSFGNKGEGPGEFRMAFTFFLEGPYVIVPDEGKVHYFTKNGKYIKSYSCSNMNTPRLFLDEYRFLTVRETEDKKEKLEIFDLNTKKYTAVGGVSDEKELAASGGGLSVSFKDVNTTPMVIAAKYNNNIYFGKNDRYFIKKINQSGREMLSFSISGREQKKIPVELKRKRFEKVRVNNQKMPKEMVDQLVKSMPDYCTLYNQITIDKKGLTYVYVNDMANETGQEIDIFSPEGKYLYHAHIQLPKGLKKVSPFIIKESSMIAFVELNDGEQKMVKFQVQKPSL